jgi:transcriptional repressor NF-X1
LRAALTPEFSAVNLDFEISFLPSGDVIIKALSSSSSWHQKTDSVLSSIKATIIKKVKSLDLASSVMMCRVDSNTNVVRKEEDHAGIGGWSQVAKGATGGKAPVVQTVGAKSSFTVLGSKGLKKKQVAEEVVEDWERDVEGWGGE